MSSHADPAAMDDERIQIKHMLRHKIDLSVDDLFDDDNEKEQQQQVVTTNDNDDEDDVDAPESPEEQKEQDPLAELQAAEALERQRLDNSSAQAWEEVMEDPVKIKLDLEQLHFSATGSMKREFASGKGPWRNKKQDDDDSDDKNDDENSSEAGAVAFGRLARHFKKAKRDPTDFFEIEGVGKWNGFTAASSAVQLLLHPEDVADICGGEHRFHKICGGEKLSQKKVALLIEMLCLLSEWWGAVDPGEHPLSFCDPDGGDDVPLSQLHICVILIRFIFLFPSDLERGELCDCRHVDVARVEMMILLVIFNWQQMSGTGGDIIELSWLWTRLLQLRPHSETKWLHWQMLFVTMFEEGKSESGANKIDSLGEYIFLNAAAAAADEPECRDALRRFSFDYLRYIVEQQPIWFSDSSGVHAKAVVAFIGKRYLGNKADPAAAAAAARSNERVPTDVCLLIAQVMEAFDIPSVCIDEVHGTTWSIGTILSFVKPHDFSVASSPRGNVLLALRAALAVSQIVDEEGQSDALNFFNCMETALLQRIWYTSDPSVALERQQARSDLGREACDFSIEYRAEEDAQSLPYFDEYKSWLLSLIALFHQQKLDVDSEVKQQLRGIAVDFSTSFEMECVERYRKVTGDHNARIRSRFGRLLLEEEEEEEETRNQILLEFHHPASHLLPSVLLPYCYGAQRIIVEYQREWDDGILCYYRKVAREFAVIIAARYTPLFAKLLEHETRERNRVVNNTKIPRQHIEQDRASGVRSIRIELMKFTEKIRDVDGLEFLVNGDSVEEQVDKVTGAKMCVYDIFHSCYARIPKRSIPRLLLEKNVYFVECVATASGEKKRIQYRCAKEPDARYPSLKQLLALEENVFHGCVVPAGVTMIDHLLFIGAWVKEESDDGIYAYNSLDATKSTWNPRRNWCLPTHLYSENSQSLVFQPTSSFNPSIFPGGGEGEGAAAAAAACSSSSSSTLAPSLSMPQILFDAAGNTYEETAAKQIVPSADSELSWVVKWVLENHPELWRCCKSTSPQSGTVVEFFFIITETTYSDMAAALGIPDLVIFVSSEEGPLSALKADGVWCSAKDDESEYWYNSINSAVAWYVEEEWMVPQ